MKLTENEIVGLDSETHEVAESTPNGVPPLLLVAEHGPDPETQRAGSNHADIQPRMLSG